MKLNNYNQCKKSLSVLSALFFVLFLSLTSNVIAKQSPLLKKNILMVLTSHSELGNTGNKTGFWLEEFAAPYYVFIDAGMSVTLASPKGGQPPMDPKSDDPANQTPATERFKKDLKAQALMSETKKLSVIDHATFDAVFYPGGHGPLWDLTSDQNSIALIETMIEDAKPVAAVCHAPAIFKNTKTKSGESLVKGKAVTGFSNTEEDAVQLTGVVPFLLEDVLKANGAVYSKSEDWQPHVVVDGKIITGQNPASSEPAAHALLELLK